MLWTVVRFPDASWASGGKPTDPDYASGEIFRVDADSREKAVKIAQGQRQRQRRKTAQQNEQRRNDCKGY